HPGRERVMVNRIWLHLLGKPLVETPNNFGLSGVEPEQQALLDHLAVRFMNQGWSIKRMIREIVLSRTYQRSSRYDPKNDEADPENRWLWRANPRQLDAESMRDAMLALAGQLDLDRPYASAVAEAGPGRPGGLRVSANVRYRSVYLPIVRDEVIEPLKLFGFPDPNITSAMRQESIVPTQALYLMNGAFALNQAEAMAADLEKQYPGIKDRIQVAFIRAYGRPATDEEKRAAVEFFRDFKSTGNEALAVFCQTLMASARFRILN
ncbi:MAG: DUF1553 domain-containing protein, partial [Verrucomicrobiota bacterium]